MDAAEVLKAHVAESCRVKNAAVEVCGPAMAKACEIMAVCIREGGKILICGNGGSAADSQHLATELVCRLSGEMERPPIPAIALTTDTSFLTAFPNDYGFDGIFARQVEALGKEGDVLIGFSTSGNSANVVQAFHTAHHKGIKTIGLLGGHGGRLKDSADVALVVPSPTTMFVQETHLVMLHVMAYVLERELYA